MLGSGTGNASAGNPALVGGLAGGGAALLLGYAWYHFSGARSAVRSISQTKQYANQITEKVKQNTPEPNQALQWLRETTQAYASFIPGARGYVDKAFDDLDKIHEKHGPEVDEVISKTYQELKQVAQKKGASLEGVYEAWSVLERCIREIGSLAGDAAEDIMNNHPELRQKLGGSFQTLQSMGQTYGPEVRDQVNETFDEVRRIFSQGTTLEAVQKAKQLVEKKTREIREKGDELWQKGLQQAQPYLEKSPKVKQLVEENKDALKQGNLGHLWAQVRNAVDSGSTQKLENFIQHTKEQMKSAGSGGGSGDGGSGGGNLAGTLSSLFGGSAGTLGSMATQSGGGGDVISNLQTLADIIQKHEGEAEGLLKSTAEELKDVIQRKTQEAEKIAANARNEQKGKTS